MESTDRPLELAPGAALPPSLTKLFAVDSRLAEVPGESCRMLHTRLQGGAAAPLDALPAVLAPSWQALLPCGPRLALVLCPASAPGLCLLTAVRAFALHAEALSRLVKLESAYLSRNPLAPASLSRLAPLHNL